MTFHVLHPLVLALTLAGLACATGASAQTQVVKPPQAQVWIDVATVGGMALSLIHI